MLVQFLKTIAFYADWKNYIEITNTLRQSHRP